MLLWSVVGCYPPEVYEANRINNCDYFPASDCCETDAGCQEFYGGDYPFCVHAGREPGGGICVECLSNLDCRGNELCIVIDLYTDATQCIDPDSCYEDTPFTWTACP